MRTKSQDSVIQMEGQKGTTIPGGGRIISLFRI